MNAWKGHWGFKNPAFDVTSNRYATAIITENGVAKPPFEFA
ncbi:MAG: hypothetical protein V1753_01560 [Pseudomonadota bacterium]